MPSYITWFYELDPANPPPSGTSINYTVLTLTDQNNNDEFAAQGADRLDGVDISQSYGNDVITVNVNGIDVTYVETTFYLSDGRRFFTSEDGQPLKAATYVGTDAAVDTQSPLLVSQLGPACFAKGTLIDTPKGPCAIETLRKGDRVNTFSHGEQPILWVGVQPGLQWRNMRPYDLPLGHTVAPGHCLFHLSIGFCFEAGRPSCSLASLKCSLRQSFLKTVKAFAARLKRVCAIFTSCSADMLC